MFFLESTELQSAPFEIKIFTRSTFPLKHAICKQVTWFMSPSFKNLPKSFSLHICSALLIIILVASITKPKFGPENNNNRNKE